MLRTGRHIHAVFMAHLSMEKALKAAYCAKTGKIPPRTHNLLFLLRESGLEIPEPMKIGIIAVNEASIMTRYPEDLDAMQAVYNRQRTKEIVELAEKLFEWLETQL